MIGRSLVQIPALGRAAMSKCPASAITEATTVVGVNISRDVKHEVNSWAVDSYNEFVFKLETFAFPTKIQCEC